MRWFHVLTSVMLLSMCSHTVRAQRPVDRYMLVFGQGDEGTYFYTQPDSNSKSTQWPGRDSALWAFDMYLFDNYSQAVQKEHEWEPLLPDSTAIRARFRAVMLADTTFERLYGQAMPDQPAPSIRMDSLMRIAARFFYLHRAGPDVTAHICTGINSVKRLPYAPGSPYYAAFCYQVIRSMEDPFVIFNRAKDAIQDSLWRDMPDPVLHRAEHEIYQLIAADPELRRLLLEAYATKQRYLNFTVEE